MVRVLLILLLAGASWATAASEFHVSPKGSDAAPGTKARPFATLQRAQEAVRKAVAAGLQEDVTVLLQGPTYELAEPLVFGPDDGGTVEHSVTYAAAPGGAVTISGGRRITGWKPAADGLWSAAVPEGLTFRQLFVSDRRAIRARTPNADEEPPGWFLADASLSPDATEYRLVLPTDMVEEWANLTDVEVVTFGEWEIFRKRLAAVDVAEDALILAGPHVPLASHPWNRPAAGKGFFLENARGFLDQPGEWYLDHATGVLTYWPLDGEDMAKAEVIAPVATGLLEMRGEPERPVRNLHFRGLRFAHAEWPLPEGGYQGVQACHYSVTGPDGVQWQVQPAALHFEFAEGCSVTDGEVAHVGGGGLFLDNGCHENLLDRNEVHDIGGNGLMVSAPDNSTPAPRGNRITNSRIHDCGVDYQGAVGIWNGMTEGTVISHNEVHHLPYTGISVGWQWNPEPTNCKGNLIEYNHIYECMRGLSDGGGIYTLGFQPGTVIRGNVIHDIRRGPFSVGAPNNGMFIDEGSKGFLFEGNVIWNTSATSVRHNQNQADWHTWTDNLFGVRVPVEGKVGMALGCDGSSVHFEVPHSPELDPAELTIEAWVRLPEFPNGGDSRRWIVNKNDDEWIEGHYGLVVNRDTVGAYLNIGGGRDNTVEVFAAEPCLKLDTWQHLAMTYDGRMLSVYCDETLVASQEVGKARVPGSTRLDIGRRQDA
jgi:hypothetical protein